MGGNETELNLPLGKALFTIVEKMPSTRHVVGFKALQFSPVFVIRSFLFSAALALTFAQPAQARPQFSAVAIDARNGQILFHDSEDGLRHPASLTKMMTLYVLFQDLKAGRISRSTELRVSARAAAMAPSKLNLQAGSTITVDDAIKALVTKSANDVAAAIAENLGGTEANFASRMTRIARSIGMNHSTFYNASGLPNPGQYTTARDMATLGLRLMRDFPQYYPYFRITEFEFHGRTIRTHNKLVQHYAGTDGIKTGYIANSGFNLVSSTRRGEKRLVGVVLGARSAPARERFMMAMLDKNFARAKDGDTIAAVAGSASGAINPLGGRGTKVEVAVAMDNRELAAAAADAAHGPIDTTGGEEDQGDNVATDTTSPAGPQVLEANLGSAPKLPTSLPFAVVSANDAPSNLANVMNTSWNIQVGAYADKSQAEASIASLRGKLVHVFQDKQGFTVAADVKGQTIYRARFAGFDAKGAKKACTLLRRSGSNCLALAPQG